MKLIKYKHAQDQLIAYARYLLAEKLDDISAFQLKIAFEYDLPLLKKLVHLSQEQLFSITKDGFIEFLTYWANGDAEKQINESLEKWNKDELEIVGKYDIEVEDITYINDIRERALNEFIPSFTEDIDKQKQVSRQIRQFILESNTASVSGYIEILQQQISKKEKQLLEAQSLAKIGSFEWDLTNDVSEFTPELRKIFGEVKRGLENWMDNVHPEDRPMVEQELKKSFTTGSYSAEYRYSVEGEEKILWSRSEVLFNKEGKAVLMRGTVQDITEWKRITQQLQQSMQEQTQLKLLNLYKDEFLNIASHELKTPLTSIKAFLQLSNTLKDPEEKVTYINKSLSHVKKLEKLIADLLDTSKLNAGQLIYNKENFDIVTLTDEVVSSFRDKHNTRIISFKHSEPIFISGDRLRIEQVLNNLIDNALKYSDSNVTVDIEKNISTVTIHITDTGVGIAKEDIEKLFDRFYRSTSVTKYYQGLGLGLYIANKITEHHGGKLQVKSELNKGSRFSIILPVELSENPIAVNVLDKHTQA